MKRIDFYKELYFQEIDRKKYLNDALNIPITLISGVVVLIFYCVTNFSFGIFFYNDVAFTIMLLTTTLITIKAIYYMAKFFAEVKIFSTKKNDSADMYKYFPYAGNYEKYRIDNKLTDEQYEEAIISTFIKCIDNNAVMNDKKTIVLWRAKKTVVVSLIVSLLLMIPFLINFFVTEKSNPTKVEITNPIKIEEYEK